MDTATTAAVGGVEGVTIPVIDGGGPIDARLRALVAEIGYMPPLRWDVHPLNASGKEEGVALRVDGHEWDDWDNTGTFPPGKYRRKLWSTSPHKSLGAVDFTVARRVNLNGADAAATPEPTPDAVARLTDLLGSIVSRLDRLETGGGGSRQVDPLLQLMLTQQSETNKILLQSLLTQKGGGGGGANVDGIIDAFTKMHDFAERIHDRGEGGGGGGGEDSLASIAKAFAPYVGPIIAEMAKPKQRPPHPQETTDGVVPPRQVRARVVSSVPPDRDAAADVAAAGDLPAGGGGVGEPGPSPLAQFMTPAQIAEIDGFISQVEAVAMTPRPSARMLALGLVDMFGDVAENVAATWSPGTLTAMLIGHAPRLEAHRGLLDSIEAEFREAVAEDGDAGGELEDAGDVETDEEEGDGQ